MYRRLILFIFLLLIIGCRGKRERQAMPEPATAFANPPEWSKKVVWYQIFVERFRNGDATNDPKPEDIKGSYPGFAPEGWAITPWTHDWYKDDPYIANITNDTYTKARVQSFGEKSQLRRYGGDLQGVLEKLDYLDSLGITAVYFNPLNDAPSLHKYDARNWRHIDRNFGPDPKKDIETIKGEDATDPSTWQFTEADKLFLKLIKELHKRNIKVVLDYSWNHTGTQFWAWKDLVENQEKSPYADWYWVKKFDDPNTDKNEFEYRGWAGVPSLPEIKETQHQNLDSGLQAFEGNVYSEQAKQHIFNVTKRWLDPNKDGDTFDGVDGFRLDVAAEMPVNFWHEFRKEVRGVNPEAYLVGEVWWEDWPDKMLDPEPFLNGKIFDASMNYRWYRVARQFFNGAPTPIDVSAFVDSLNYLRSTVNKANNYAMMNVAASHDVPRVLTSLFNKNQFKYKSKPDDDSSYKINKPDEATHETLKLLLAHQFTYIGTPHIWAGDEMGMWGADDPSNRKPLIWPDYDFEPETHHPTGIPRPTDAVRFNKDLFSFYSKLAEIRNENEVLNTGELQFVLLDDDKGVLAYSRFDDGAEILTIFNTNSESKEVKIPKKLENAYETFLNGGNVVSETKDTLTIRVLPRKASILGSKQ